MTALASGEILNDTYRVEALLGRGGMAEVYTVAHTRLPRRFALKLLRLDLGQRTRFLARFQREAEILGRLRHPHIVDVTDWNHTPAGAPYLVMELLAGEDLGRFLRRNGAFSPASAIEITAQIGAALLAAHSVGVVHRDLKPSNIFLLKNAPLPRFVKVLDFGIARRLDLGDRQGDGQLTAEKEILGTPGYMAPEQARGKTGEADARADQFALAAIFYELVTGRPAFAAPERSLAEILDRLLHSEPPPLPAGRVAPQVAEALHRALRKEPHQRFATLAEFLSAIGAQPAQTYSVSTSPSEPPTARREGALTEVTQRRQLALAAACALALLLAIWAAFVFWL